MGFSWTHYTEHRGREGANCGAGGVVNDGNAIDGRVSEETKAEWRGGFVVVHEDGF
jgi:hypothetical protein